MTDDAEVLRRPDPEAVAKSRLTAFRTWLQDEVQIDAANYDEWWRRSAGEPGAYWCTIARFVEELPAGTPHVRPTLQPRLDGTPLAGRPHLVVADPEAADDVGEARLSAAQGCRRARAYR